MQYFAIKIQREDGSVQVAAIIEYPDEAAAPNALALYEGWQDELTQARQKAEEAGDDFDEENHSFEDYLRAKHLRCVSFTTDTIFE